MIGIIISGHGSLASGFTDALKLTTGKPEKYISIDFLQEDTADDIEFKIRDAVKELSAVCKDGVLIFTDIVNATPYNEAVEIANKTTEIPVRVISGTSLGMIMEANMARGYLTDIDALADIVVEGGKRQPVKYTVEE